MSENVTVNIYHGKTTPWVVIERPIPAVTRAMLVNASTTHAGHWETRDRGETWEVVTPPCAVKEFVRFVPDDDKFLLPEGE